LSNNEPRLSYRRAALRQNDRPLRIQDGRSDGTKNGGCPDPRDGKRRGIEPREIHIDDRHIDTMEFKAHNFDRGLSTVAPSLI